MRKKIHPSVQATIGKFVTCLDAGCNDSHKESLVGNPKFKLLSHPRAFIQPTWCENPMMWEVVSETGLGSVKQARDTRNCYMVHIHKPGAQDSRRNATILLTDMSLWSTTRPDGRKTACLCSACWARRTGSSRHPPFHFWFCKKPLSPTQTGGPHRHATQATSPRPSLPEAADTNMPPGKRRWNVTLCGDSRLLAVPRSLRYIFLVW